MSIKEQLSKLPDDMLKKEMLKFILKEVDVSDEIYQKSFQDTYKVNVDICGVKGYQIYEKDKYIPKFGESLQDPDVNIMFRNMDYVRQLLQGEKVGIEAGRDSNYVLHLNRKDTLFSTRMRTEERNAQVLLAKIPIFNQVVKNFGTSRQGRRLRDQPDIDPVKDGEIASLMKKMLSETVDDTDDLYRKNFQGQVLKVNWDIAGNFAYQIFEEIRYSYEFGKHIEDTDLTLVSKNPEHAKRFLQNISTNYAPGLDDDDNLLIYVKNPVISIQFKDPDATRFSLVKLPFFRTMSQQQSNSETSEEEKDERENYGHYVPVNLPMGDFEDVIVPYKVLEHFINKASNIVLRTCPCRERWDCQNHDHSLGCIFMGDDTKNMALSPDEGHVATKEQALEHVKNAIADGLVPLLGRNVAEAEDGHGVRDTGRFLSGCFCCECCCIGVKTRQYGVISSMGGDSGGNMEGWKISVDESECDCCQTCVEVCPFNGMKILDGKASVDPVNCVGCGRCVDACPNGAITVEIEDPNYIEKYITKIESIVDVTKQKTKT